MVVIGKVKLTPARRRGLQVLLDAARAGRPARISNVTGPHSRTVYWQVADHLVKEGLARVTSQVAQTVVLTPAGRKLAERIEHET